MGSNNKTRYEFIAFLLIFILGMVTISIVYSSMTVRVLKPAVYLYPEEASDINVHVIVNGEITISDPEYNSGWNVSVETNGLIDNQYDYLFYEADLRYLEIPQEGWCILQNELEDWMDITLEKYGLNEKEISDFKEYWLETLQNNEFYIIKIVSTEFLEENLKLIIDPNQDTLIRVFFVFIPFDSRIELEEPTIYTPVRSGFVVVEWGGVIKPKPFI
ncbi:MAG: hypothetical protein ACTSUV_05615 [Candidatus Ranarchaeia archaeon]